MNQSQKLSIVTLAKKVEWEGGVLAALEYGIRSEDIEDEGVRALWEEVETRYRSLTPLVTRIDQELRRAA